MRKTMPRVGALAKQGPPIPPGWNPPIANRDNLCAMLIRWMLIAGIAACSAAPDPTTTPVAPPVRAGDVLGPDGTHVASERVYQGECSPPGSRGGCHTVTLRPDGTYRNFLFDAAIEGTYRIEGRTVTLRGPDPGASEQATLSADGTMLGALTLER